MEILIPGLILVALMVYLSTRIKRAAARAFEPEIVENKDFSLTKPEGFLHRVGGQYAFEAYSKEFGHEPADEIRAATAVVVVYDSLLIDAAVDIESTRLTKIVSKKYVESGGVRTASLAGELLQDSHPISVKCRAIEKNGRTVMLRIELLKELEADFSRRTEEMLSSFQAR